MVQDRLSFGLRRDGSRCGVDATDRIPALRSAQKLTPGQRAKPEQNTKGRLLDEAVGGLVASHVAYAQSARAVAFYTAST